MEKNPEGEINPGAPEASKSAIPSAEGGWSIDSKALEEALPFEQTLDAVREGNAWPTKAGMENEDIKNALQERFDAMSESEAQEFLREIEDLHAELKANINSDFSTKEQLALKISKRIEKWIGTGALLSGLALSAALQSDSSPYAPLAMLSPLAAAAYISSRIINESEIGIKFGTKTDQLNKAHEHLHAMQELLNNSQSPEVSAS